VFNFTVLYWYGQNFLMVEGGTKLNALLSEDALDGGGTEAKFDGDVVAAFALGIALDDSGSERRSAFRFAAGCFGDQTGDALFTKSVA
jgi:hypothetical protein